MTDPKPLSRLKVIRLERKASRRSAANAIGVSDKTMQRWEAGDQSPTIEDAKKLARFYGVDLNELSGWNQEQQAV